MAKRSRIKTDITADVTADLRSVEKHQKAMKALAPKVVSAPSSVTRYVRREPPPPGLTPIEKLADRFGYVKKPW